jgi:hypothetical protein
MEQWNGGIMVKKNMESWVQDKFSGVFLIFHPSNIPVFHVDPVGG